MHELNHLGVSCLCCFCCSDIPDQKQRDFSDVPIKNDSKIQTDDRVQHIFIIRTVVE